MIDKVKIMSRFRLPVLAYALHTLLILLLAGCVRSGVFIAENRVALAEQTPNRHFEQEVMVVRLSQVLAGGGINKAERAALHFERGVLYDALGLWGLSRYDFAQTLALQPKMPAVYNYLGLYQLLENDYDGALETFNAVLELDPHYDYGYLNRGLNFYYIGRYNLAEQDLLRFYQADKSDPYRMLWLYFNELNLMPEQAAANLAQRADGVADNIWGSRLVQYFLGNISLRALFDHAETFAANTVQYAEILTETYFYLAKQKLNLGRIDEAAALFKLAMANQVYNFVEYRFAAFELKKLKPVQRENEE